MPLARRLAIDTSETLGMHRELGFDLSRLLLRGDDLLLDLGDCRAGLCDQAVGQFRAEARIERLDGERDCLDRCKLAAQGRRNSGRQWSRFLRVAIVAPLKQKGFDIGLLVEDARDAVLQDIAERRVFLGAGRREEPVGPNVMRLEEGSKTKILFLRDRVELVIVAAATLQREAQERLTGVFDEIEHPDVAVELVPVPPDEAGRGQSRHVGRGNFISGQHLDQHPVVRLVVVERIDDPVSPPPDVTLAVPDLVDRAAAIPVGVPPDIHPMPSPTLAVLRPLQQIIDHSFVVARFGAGRERTQFVARWRQADQIEMNSPQPRRAIGLAHGSQSEFFMLRRQKRIDGSPHPLGMLHDGNGRSHDGSIRPPVARIGLRLLIGWPRRAAVDPLFEQLDLVSGERRPVSIRRHLDVTGASDNLDEPTLHSVTRHDDGSALATLLQQRDRIDSQAALLLQRPVTRRAFVQQQRLDLLEVVRRVVGQRNLGS